MKEAVTSNLSGNDKIKYLKENQWKNFTYPLPSENFDELSPAQQNDVEVAYEQCMVGQESSGTADGDSANQPEGNPEGLENKVDEGGNAGTAESPTGGSDSGPTTDGATGVSESASGTGDAGTVDQTSHDNNQGAETTTPAEPTADATVEKPVEDVEKSVEQTEGQPEEGSVNA